MGICKDTEREKGIMVFIEGGEILKKVGVGGKAKFKVKGAIWLKM